MLPPKPTPRPDKVSLWQYFKLFRKDILSAQPARLYRAWMAEFKTPFFRSYLCNDPELVDLVLRRRPEDFPKSERIGKGLRPLLRDSVFLTNGPAWARQRRIIDPAFEGGRLRDTLPAMWAAGEACVTRLKAQAKDTDATGLDIEAETSHAAADVIFRTLFSIPIEDQTASAVFQEFRAHQKTAPVANLAALLPWPRWMPHPHRKETRSTARRIRLLIETLTLGRAETIARGTAPDDLATKIMTTPDPLTGMCFDTEEMVDQVAIFFLAGHETSASALAWALYLLASHPHWQDAVAAEAATLPAQADMAALGRLKLTRAVFREAMRLYPPVPMMVRETSCPEHFRDRDVPKKAQIVISPWHLHRHARLWDNPDGFDPARWQTENGKACQRSAYIPFSAGTRVCPGAGFAMAEGPLLLAMLVRAFRFDPVDGRAPVPVAHLTVRGEDGIWLRVEPREVHPRGST
ncbi:cytochrome [Thioclava sp. SK-1]|uniref:cytochrome P450 n=1 Tax=Thioclava sp. SK-1 TaxID=1889770 RepID=UPI0008263E33|nr:cytochrome P450 [Thioclava sp. SK-1]OCX66213.1 cytochrome [Thioclava sp. SK-1]